MNELFTFGFYNLENLFDVIDHPEKNDDDFTAYRRKRWTRERYDKKLVKLSTAISEIGKNKTGKFPSVLGVCEVENKYVLEDLLQVHPLSEKNYDYVHYESLDERGIDCALIYDTDLFSVVSSQTITVDLYNEDGSSDYTRDLLHVEGDFCKQRIHFVVAHFPSRRHGDVNRPKRKIIAKALRNLLDDLLIKDKDAKIMVLGDFNANPRDPDLKDILQLENHPDKLSEKQLYNPMEGLHTYKQGSLMYKKRWFLFDQIFLSKSFFDEETLLEYSSAHVFNPQLLMERKGKHRGAPFRTFLGNKYLGGYSDHFPVYVTIKI